MESIYLNGNTVFLRLMTTDDVEGIYACSQDERIWTHLSRALQTKEDVQNYIEQALINRETGTEYPFVIVLRETNKVIGSTRFLDISSEHKRLEIGWTWLHPSFWRTTINTECKYLLLSYCFEQLQFQRVQIKTGHENIQSQKAIERIGAKKEGVLRNHMIRPNRKVRHTVMYSVIKEEWHEVKKHLEKLMEKYEN
ncbi:GNAT family N-acetyltransferase [Sporosarcina sp. G11-34]|uniref:GNAT family N-acetyltransferase n=1 Tax=Sporosarcina sp. G11-34 TaxID=2849605 RepID=UPI0022A936FC|nr:GNAT family N-acetyltransferase [Sporosarcina sp. G11-34]MCZ2259518.1 GNAT family N-acetyltransferase [Sporosarcina sp. G11-34]